MTTVIAAMTTHSAATHTRSKVKSGTPAVPGSMRIRAAVASTHGLFLALSHIKAPRFVYSVRPTAPVRFLGGSLVFIAISLASAWIAMWAALRVGVPA